MTRTVSKYQFVCQHCGRVWDAEGMQTRTRSSYSGVKRGANTGFVAAASAAHESFCGGRSPAQRRTVNARDEARWEKTPPTASRIWNDPHHPGLKGPLDNAV